MGVVGGEWRSELGQPANVASEGRTCLSAILRLFYEPG